MRTRRAAASAAPRPTSTTRAAGLLARLGLAAALTFTLTVASGCGGAQDGQSSDPVQADPLETVGAEELYRRAGLLAEGGDYVRAEQYLAAAMQRGLPQRQAMPLLMQVCIQASRLVAALSYAEPYLAQNPEEWSLRMLVASIHMGLQRHDRAREHLERVLEDAPEEPPQAHYFLGVLYRDAFDDSEASLRHFRRYLALAPEGEHRSEARAALPPEERGVPERIEAAPAASEATSGGEPASGGPPRRLEACPRGGCVDPQAEAGHAEGDDVQEGSAGAREERAEPRRPSP